MDDTDRYVDTEIHTCTQVNYKTFKNPPEILETMDILIEHLTTQYVEKLVIQPRPKKE